MSKNKMALNSKNEQVPKNAPTANAAVTRTESSKKGVNAPARPIGETSLGRRALCLFLAVLLGISGALVDIPGLLMRGEIEQVYADDLVNTVPSDERYSSTINNYAGRSFTNISGVYQSNSPTSITSFGSALPLSTIYINQDKIWADQNSATPVSDAIFTPLSTDPGIKHDTSSHRVSYDPSVGNVELLAGQKNEIEGPLFSFTFPNAAEYTDADGNIKYGDVVFTYSNAVAFIDQRYIGNLGGKLQKDYYLATGAKPTWGSDDRTDLSTYDSAVNAVINSIKNGETTYADQTGDTIGKAYYGNNSNITTGGKYPQVGGSIDITISVIDKEKVPVPGTFVIATTGINLDRSPRVAGGNNVNKAMWYYYKDYPEYFYFSEAMSINSGQFAENVYVRNNDKNVMDSKSRGGFYPDVIKDSNGKTKFISNSTNQKGSTDGSYTSGFVTLGNAATGLTVTSTGHGGGSSGGTMNSPFFNSSQFWYKYKSSTGPNGNIQTTQEGNHEGKLTLTGSNQDSVLGQGTYVVMEGKTIKYTMTPDYGYKIRTLEIAKADGTLDTVKFNGELVSKMKKGDELDWPTAAGKTGKLKYELDGTYTFEFPYALHNEEIHVEWEPTTADILVSKAWYDDNDKDGMRVGSDGDAEKWPQIKLQRSLNGGLTWSDVTVNANGDPISPVDAPSGKDDNPSSPTAGQYLDGVYEINNDTGSGTIPHPYTWQYLPMYQYDSNGKTAGEILYRIVEGNPTQLSHPSYATANPANEEVLEGYKKPTFYDVQQFNLISDETRSIDGLQIYKDGSGQEYIYKSDNKYYPVTNWVASANPASTQPTDKAPNEPGSGMSQAESGEPKLIEYNGAKYQVIRNNSRKPGSKYSGQEFVQIGGKYYRVIYNQISSIEVVIPADDPTDPNDDYNDFNDNLTNAVLNGFNTADKADPYKSVAVRNDHDVSDIDIEVTKEWNDAALWDSANNKPIDTEVENGNEYNRRDITFVLHGTIDDGNTVVDLDPNSPSDDREITLSKDELNTRVQSAGSVTTSEGETPIAVYIDKTDNKKYVRLGEGTLTDPYVYHEVTAVDDKDNGISGAYNTTPASTQPDAKNLEESLNVKYKVDGSHYGVIFEGLQAYWNGQKIDYTVTEKFTQADSFTVTGGNVTPVTESGEIKGYTLSNLSKVEENQELKGYKGGFINTPIVDDEYEPLPVTIQKLDAYTGEPLPNAEFTVYTDLAIDEKPETSTYKQINGLTVYKEAGTGNQYVKKTDGKYYAVTGDTIAETAATSQPDSSNLTKLKNENYKKVKSGGVEYEVWTDKKGHEYIKKGNDYYEVDIDGNVAAVKANPQPTETLVRIEVEGAVDEIVVVTDENGKATFTFHETGIYTIKETSAPDGYIPDGGDYQFDVSKELKQVKYKNPEDDEDHETHWWQRLYDLIFGPRTNQKDNWSQEDDKRSGTLTVENEPLTAHVLVRKLWDDANDQDGVRPNTDAMLPTMELQYTTKNPSDPTFDPDNDWIIAEYYNPDKKDGQGKPAPGLDIIDVKKTTYAGGAIHKDDNNAYTWIDIPAYRGGKVVYYRILEEGTVLDNGTYRITSNRTVATGDENFKLVDKDNKPTNQIVEVKNTHTPQIITINATKHWVDNENADGKRPSRIKIALYREVDNQETKLFERYLNGEADENEAPQQDDYDQDADGQLDDTEQAAYDAALTAYNAMLNSGAYEKDPTDDNTWNAIFENLPAFANGARIKYRLEETLEVEGENDPNTWYVKTYSVKYIGTNDVTVDEEGPDSLLADSVKRTSETVDETIKAGSVTYDVYTKDGKRYVRTGEGTGESQYVYYEITTTDSGETVDLSTPANPQPSEPTKSTITKETTNATLSVANTSKNNAITTKNWLGGANANIRFYLYRTTFTEYEHKETGERKSVHEYNLLDETAQKNYKPVVPPMDEVDSTADPIKTGTTITVGSDTYDLYNHANGKKYVDKSTTPGTQEWHEVLGKGTAEDPYTIATAKAEIKVNTWIPYQLDGSGNQQYVNKTDSTDIKTKAWYDSDERTEEDRAKYEILLKPEWERVTEGDDKGEHLFISSAFSTALVLPGDDEVHVFENLRQMDGDGNPYAYRVFETTTGGSWTDERFEGHYSEDGLTVTNINRLMEEGVTDIDVLKDLSGREWDAKYKKTNNEADKDTFYFWIEPIKGINETTGEIILFSDSAEDQALKAAVPLPGDGNQYGRARSQNTAVGTTARKVSFSPILYDATDIDPSTKTTTFYYMVYESKDTEGTIVEEKDNKGITYDGEGTGSTWTPKVEVLKVVATADANNVVTAEHSWEKINKNSEGAVESVEWTKQTPIFKNTYSSSGEAKAWIEKNIQSRQWTNYSNNSGDAFQFTITSIAGAKLNTPGGQPNDSYVTNPLVKEGTDANPQHDLQQFTDSMWAFGVNGNPYTGELLGTKGEAYFIYEITENPSATSDPTRDALGLDNYIVDGLTYDDSKIYAKVKVTDNWDGTLSFDINYYTDASCKDKYIINNHKAWIVDKILTYDEYVNKEDPTDVLTPSGYADITDDAEREKYRLETRYLYVRKDNSSPDVKLTESEYKALPDTEKALYTNNLKRLLDSTEREEANNLKAAGDTDGLKEKGYREVNIAHFDNYETIDIPVKKQWTDGPAVEDVTLHLERHLFPLAEEGRLDGDNGVAIVEAAKTHWFSDGYVNKTNGNNISKTAYEGLSSEEKANYEPAGDFWQRVGYVHDVKRGEFINDDGTPKYDSAGSKTSTKLIENVEGFNKDLPKYVVRHGVTYRAVYMLVEDNTSDAYQRSYDPQYYINANSLKDKDGNPTDALTVKNKVVATNTANIAAVKQLLGRTWMSTDDFPFTLTPVGKATYNATTGEFASVDDSENAKNSVPMPENNTTIHSTTNEETRVATTHAKDAPPIVDPNGNLERLARFGAIRYEISDLEYNKKSEHYQGDFFYTMKEKLPEIVTEGANQLYPVEYTVIKNKGQANEETETKKIENKAMPTLQAGETLKSVKFSNGITYDCDEHTVHVRVRENRTGTLEVQIGYDETTQGTIATGTQFTPVYTNKYEAETEVTVPVNKYIRGRDWVDKDNFDFRMIPMAGAPFTDADPTDFPEQNTYSHTERNTQLDAGNAVHNKEGEHIIRVTPDDGKTGDKTDTHEPVSFDFPAIKINISDLNKVITEENRTEPEANKPDLRVYDVTGYNMAEGAEKETHLLPLGTVYGQFMYAIEETKEFNDVNTNVVKDLEPDPDTEYARVTVYDIGDGVLKHYVEIFEDRYGTVPRYVPNPTTGENTDVKATAVTFVNKLKRDLSVTKAWAGAATEDVTLKLQWSINGTNFFDVDGTDWFPTNVQGTKIIPRTASGENLTVTWEELPAYANITGYSTEEGSTGADILDLNDKWVYYQVVEVTPENAEVRYNEHPNVYAVGDEKDNAKYRAEPYHTGKEFREGTTDTYIDPADRVKQLHVTNFPKEIKGTANIGVVKQYIGKSWDNEEFEFEITPIKSKLGGDADYVEEGEQRTIKNYVHIGDGTAANPGTGVVIGPEAYEALDNGKKSEYREDIVTVTNRLPAFNGTHRNKATAKAGTGGTTQVSVNERAANFDPLTILRADLGLDLDTHKVTGEFIYKITEVVPAGVTTSEVCQTDENGDPIHYYVAADDGKGNKIKYTTEEHLVKIVVSDDGGSNLNVTVSFDERATGEFVPVYTNYAMMKTPIEGEKTWIGGEKKDHKNGTVTLSADEKEILNASDELGLKLQYSLDGETFVDVLDQKDAAGRDLVIVWAKGQEPTTTVSYEPTIDTTVDPNTTYYIDQNGTEAQPQDGDNPETLGWFEKVETTTTFKYVKQEGEDENAEGKGNSGPYTYTIMAKVTEDVDDGQGGTTQKTTYVSPFLNTTDKDGNAYIYRIQEEDVPDNYKESYDPTKLLNVTNTYNVKDSLKVTKTWDDAQNAEGLRPDKVIVHLYKVVDVAPLTDAEIAAAEATVDTTQYSDKWTYNGTDYPTEADAQEAADLDQGDYSEITFVSEADQIDAAKAEAVANAREQKNKDTTPVHIEVVRKEITPKNGEKDTWSTGIVWNDLDVYDEKGNVIKYVVIEESVYGYKTTYAVDTAPTDYKEEGDRALEVELDGDKTTTQTIDVKNSLAPATNKVEVTKIWDDQNNIDGARPDSGVTFILKKYVWDETLNSGKGGYKETAEEVTKRPATQADVQADTTGTIKLGDEITVTRMVLEGTATATPGTIWNETTTGGATASTWKGEWINLPLTENGKTILYIVEEVTSDADKFGEPGTAGKYSNKPIITGDQIKGYTVTNEYTPEETEFIGIKKWVDDDATITHNNSADLPAKLTLYRTNVVPNNWDENTQWTNLGTLAALDATKAPNAHVDWSTSTGAGSQKDDTFTITGLAKKDGNGTTYYYKVVETTIEGYQTTYLNSAATNSALSSRTDALYSGGTIENAAKVGNVEITKKFVYNVYDDNGDVIGTTPIPKAALPSDFKIKVTYVWNNTTEKKFEKKTEELKIGDLTPDANGVYKWTLTNVAAGTKVTAEEIGYDSPTGYSYKSTTATVNGDNESKHLSENPTYAEFTMPANAVSNAPVLRAYNPGTGTEPENPSIAFVNTYTRDTGTIEPEKIWDDNKNAANKRPDTVTFTITAKSTNLSSEYAIFDDGSGGKKSSMTFTFAGAGAGEGDADIWTMNEDFEHQIKNLPTHTADGNQIKYVVEEKDADVPTGYQRLYPQANPVYIELSKGAVAKAEITNVYTVVEITKKWIDVDSTAVRPTANAYKNMVKLYADGIEKTGVQPEVTDNGDGTYTIKWVGLPKKNGTSVIDTDIVYTVRELPDSDPADTVPGYAKGVYSNLDNPNTSTNESSDKAKAYNGGTITNTQLVKVSVVKEWNDNNDHDGQRPTQIKVTLYQNGVPYKTSVLTTGEKTLKKADATIGTNATTGNETWTWTDAWKDLPYADANGSVYNYTATETNIGDGTGLWGILGNEGTIRQILLNAWNTNKDTLTFTITNSDDEDKISFAVDKIWDDGNDVDNLRPNKIYYRLYQSYEGQTATAGEEVLVNALPTGANVYSATNTATESSTWADATYTNGYVEVDANKGDKTQGTLNRIIFENLPKFAPGGKEITYTIKEDGDPTTTDIEPVLVYNTNKANAVKPYTSVITGDHKKGFIVKNTHTPVFVTKTVEAKKQITGRAFKAGDEFTFLIASKNNAPRPAVDYVTIKPTSGNEATITLPLFTFHGSDMTDKIEKDETKTFEYTMTEVTGDLEDMTYDTTPKTLKITVTRKEDGTIEIKDAGVVWGDGSAGADTYVNEYGATKTLTLRKVWVDVDADGTVIGERPASVKFTVTATIGTDAGVWATDAENKLMDAGFTKDASNSKKYTRVYTLTTGDAAAEDTAHTWQIDTAALPKYDAIGDAITYSVSEDQVPNYSEPKVVVKGNLYTITNEYVRTAFTATKVWLDGGKVHDNETELTDKLTVERYGTVYTYNGVDYDTLDGAKAAADAHQSAAPGAGDYTGITNSAKWKAVEDAHIHWNEATSSAPHTQSFTITGIPEFDETGARYTYRVTEGDVTSINPDYVTTYDNSASTDTTLTAEQKAATNVLYNGGKVINKLVRKDPVTGTKVWVGGDDSDHDNTYITSIELWRESKTNGGAKDEAKVAEATAIDNWTAASGDAEFSFGAIDGATSIFELGEYDVYDDAGYEYRYFVKNEVLDDSIKDLYKASYEDLTVTNTYKYTEVTVTKKWNGKPEADVTVNLLADGVEVASHKFAISDLTDGRATFTFVYKGQENAGPDMLDRFKANGEEVVYTIEEENGTRYEVDIIKTDSGEWIVTNTGRTIDIAIRKVWDDKNDHDGLRPDAVSITLMQNGVKYSGVGENPAILNEDNNWTYIFKDLPNKDSSGNLYIYKVVEEAVPSGYTVSYFSKDAVADKTDGTVASSKEVTITNKHNVVTEEIVATKIWVDGESGSPTMHTDVILHLYGTNANGRILYDAGVKKIEMDANGQPKGPATWTDLPSHHYSNADLTWIIVEESVPGYSSKVVEVQPNEFEVTNTFDEPITKVTVEKDWQDNGNVDGKRPEKVSYQLWKKVGDNAAVKVGEAVEAEESPASPATDKTGQLADWGYQWTDLPATEEVKTGTESVEHLEIETRYRNIHDGTDISADEFEALDPAGTPTKSEYTQKTEEVPVDPATYFNNNDPAVEIGQDAYDLLSADEKLEYTQKTETKLVDPAMYFYNNDPTVEIDQAAYDLLPEWTQADYELYDKETVTPEDIDVYETMPVIYWVEEIYTDTDLEKNGYNAPVIEALGEGKFKAINTRNRDTKDLEIQKIWDDNDNAEGVRPDHVAFKLTTADGETYIHAGEKTISNILVGEENGWKVVVHGVPVNQDGKVNTPVEYKVEEVEVPMGYYVAYFSEDTAGDKTDGTIGNSKKVTVKNTHIPGETLVLKVIKQWQDSDGTPLPSQPHDVTFRLIQVHPHDDTERDMGDAFERTIPAGAEGDDLVVIWSDLPETVNHMPVTYTVEEVPIDGYTTIMPDGVVPSTETGIDLEITVINKKHMITVTYKEPATFNDKIIQGPDEIARDQNEPAAPADPSHDGYTFLGWTRSEDASGNVVYTAKYAEIIEPEPVPVEEVKFKVTYLDPKAADGSMILKATKYNTSAEANDEAKNKTDKPDNPSHPNYDFVGWVANQDEFGDWIVVAKYNEKLPEPVTKKTTSYIDPVSGRLIKSEVTDDPSSVEPPTPATYDNMQFVEWAEIVDANGNTVFVAKYASDCRNTPAPPAPPAEPAKTPSAAPMTGDMNNMMLWILVAVIAVSTMLIILLLRQRSKTKKR